ncbi:MAG: hypothetical protein KQI62_09040 [Deltaproteobacteria bacterium]|nr:hypothetical protein [Deltaproteobacteria bacterium]
MPKRELGAQNPEATTSLIIEPRRIPGQEPFFDLSLQEPGADSPLVCALAVSPRAVVESLAVFLGNAFDLDIGKLDELICTACREAT